MIPASSPNISLSLALKLVELFRLAVGMEHIKVQNASASRTRITLINFGQNKPLIALCIDIGRINRIGTSAPTFAQNKAKFLVMKVIKERLLIGRSFARSRLSQSRSQPMRHAETQRHQ